MAVKAANLVTPGKKQKKSLFLCEGHPCWSLLVQGAFVSHQRGTKGNTSSYLLGALLLVLFSFPFSFAFFWKTETDPFLGNQSTFVWSSPNPCHLISKHSFICLPQMPAIVPWALLEFLWGSYSLPCKMSFWRKSNWTHTQVTPSSWLGYCCMYLCQVCTRLHRAIYSWGMQLHIVIILTEHTNK